MLEPLGVLAGKVVDAETGQPIGAFNVRLGSSFGSSQSEPQIRITSRLQCPGYDFVSDDGTFTIGEVIRRGACSLYATAAGYAVTRVGHAVARAADAHDPPAIIRMEKGKAISGTAVDAQTRRVVPGAEVLLATASYGFRDPFEMQELSESVFSSLRVQKTVTGPDGRFEFAHAPTWGELAVVVRSPGHAVWLAVKPATRQPLAVRLEPGGAIEGTARDFPGLAFHKADVDAYGAGLRLERIPLEEDGTFRIDGLPAGQWTLTLREDWQGRQRARVKVAAGQTARLDFAKPPGFTVSGRVTRGGAPWAGAQVEIGPVMDWAGWGTTDAEGRFRIAGILPGTYPITAREIDERPRTIIVFSGCNPAETDETMKVTVVDKDVWVDLAFPASHAEGRPGRTLVRLRAPVPAAGSPLADPNALPESALLPGALGRDLWLARLKRSPAAHSPEGIIPMAPP